MAAIGDRIEGWVNKLSERWKDQLRGWLMRTIGEGVTKFAEELEPGAIEGYREGIAKLRDNPLTPPELRAFYDKALTPGNPISVTAAMLVMVLQSFGVLLGGSQPLANLFAYQQDIALQTFRLDPLSVITAWRRNRSLGEAFFDDLRDQGWTEPRIDVLKLVTQFLPSADEQTLWLAREVFEPDMIRRYGLDAELPVYDNTDFSKIGVTPEQMVNKWRAHWEHASFMQVVEMLHRGTLTLDQEMPAEPRTPEEWAARDAAGSRALFEWYRLVEIPPFWRNKLTEMSWNVPTRVDVRRWWDMRTINEQELYSIYHRQGYHGKDLENYVRWTKVYTDFPNKIAQWQKGWITEQDVRDWLKSLDIPDERIEDFIREKIEPEEAARVEEGRSLTKTEIYKGIKQGRITPEEGVDLIVELGYNRAEAEYLVSINVESLAGSPENFPEFLELTQKWRAAVAKPSRPVSEALKEAAEQVKKWTDEVQTLEKALDDLKKTTVGEEPLPEPAATQVSALQVKVNRARAELIRVQGEYKSLLAQWRQEEAE